MKDKQCSVCWEIPCICGKIYKDTTSNNLARLLKGIKAILVERGEQPEFLLNGREISDHVVKIKTKENTISTKDFIESITSEEWHITFQEFILKYKYIHNAWDGLRSNKLRGKFILQLLLWTKSFTDKTLLDANYYGIILPTILRTIFSEQLVPKEQCEHIITLATQNRIERYSNIQKYIEKIINVCEPPMIPWYETIKLLSLLQTTETKNIIKTFLELLRLLAGLEPFSLDEYIRMKSFDVFAIEDAETTLLDIFKEFNTNPF